MNWSVEEPKHKGHTHPNFGHKCVPMRSRRSQKSGINRALKKGSPTLYTAGVCTVSPRTRTRTHSHTYTLHSYTHSGCRLAGPLALMFLFFPPVRSMPPHSPVTVAFQSEPSPPLYLQNTHNHRGRGKKYLRTPIYDLDFE